MTCIRTPYLLLAVALCIPVGCADNAGTLYHDGNRSSVSDRAQGIDPWDRVLPGIEVALLNAETEIQTVTDSLGAFDFGTAPPGAYVIDPIGIPRDVEATTHNRPLRVPQAVREGHLDLVAIGDSIGAYGADTRYPEYLARRLRAIVDTALTNLAVPGSTSCQWLPGAETGYFDRRLAPVLPEADVVTMTLGGNDVLQYLEAITEGERFNPVKLYRLFYEQAIPNVRTVIREIRRINPDCDVAFVIYPNFANNSYVYEYIGRQLQPAASMALKAVFSSEREILAGTEGVVFADMFGAMGDTWMDPFQIDPLHPNDRGHQLYAAEVFRALGGIEIEPAELLERHFGFYAPALVD